ncbi:MAG: glycosyltransferase family 4 protein [Peptococcaceae bacterium]|nr:glycosyltransferase family 4 protein [Peptococcaceae bacterium]
MKTKILHIVTLSEIGGVQKIVYHLAAESDRNAFDITVACAPGGELVGWLRDIEIKVITIPQLKRNISLFHDLFAFWKLYLLLRKGSYDIVHCHSSKAGILGRLAARLAGVPKIYFTAHGWSINEYQSLPVRYLYTLVEKIAGAISTKIICVSRDCLLNGLKLKIASQKKFVLIYNGLPEPEQRNNLLRKELNIGKEDLIFGMVARLAAPKDAMFFLKLAEHMINNRESFVGKTKDKTGFRNKIYFVLIGDGPQRAACQAFIKDKGLTGHVFLLGTRENAAELIHDFDVFTLFSRWEGLPLTVIEAMLAGRPVVASDIGGVGELVVHGETGYLIKQGNLAEAVEVSWKLAENKELRLSMGEAGRRRALEHYSLKTMVEKYRELYLS